MIVLIIVSYFLIWLASITLLLEAISGTISTVSKVHALLVVLLSISLLQILEKV